MRRPRRTTTGRAWSSQLRSTCSSTSARVWLAHAAVSLRTLIATIFVLLLELVGFGRAKSTCTSCSGLAAPSEDAEHVIARRVIFCLRELSSASTSSSLVISSRLHVDFQ